MNHNGTKLVTFYNYNENKLIYSISQKIQLQRNIKEINCTIYFEELLFETEIFCTGLHRIMIRPSQNIKTRKVAYR